MKLHALILRAKKPFSLRSPLLRASFERVIARGESDTLTGAFGGVVGGVDEFKSHLKTANLDVVKLLAPGIAKTVDSPRTEPRQFTLQSQFWVVSCFEMSTEFSRQLIPSMPHAKGLMGVEGLSVDPG